MTQHSCSQFESTVYRWPVYLMDVPIRYIVSVSVQYWSIGLISVSADSPSCCIDIRHEMLYWAIPTLHITTFMFRLHHDDVDLFIETRKEWYSVSTSASDIHLENLTITHPNFCTIMYIKKLNYNLFLAFSQNIINRDGLRSRSRSNYTITQTEPVTTSRQCKNYVSDSQSN